jgi:toxin ParE1/3/4
VKLSVRYSALARQDLLRIRQWTLKTFGPQQANSYVRSVHNSLLHIAENPGLALDASHLRPELFKVITGSHVAFLRLTATSVDVVRILHGSMDFDRWV